MSNAYSALHDMIEETRQELRVPGVALGVWHDGKAHTAGFGVTSLENPLPVDGDTLFQIGSTTKTVTATAVMRLVERGLLELDEPVRTYLPGLQLSDEASSARVTMRHLLTHTSGWVGDYFEDFGPCDDAIARYVARMRELPQLSPPGALFSYNNANFWLAGRVIEVLTGQTWEAAIKSLVLAPLGMRRSFFFADDAITYRFAVGHHVGAERVTVARRWSFPRRRPSGSIISTASDQLRYARFHLGDGATVTGERLLTPESLAQMQTPQVPRDLADGAVGLSWMIHSVADTRIVQHGGATNGQMSAFVMVPSRDFAITILTNADVGAVLHRRVTQWALANLLDLREADVPHYKMPTSELSAYVGRYCTPACALNIALPDVDLSLRDGYLYAQFEPRGGYPTKDSPQPPPPPTRLAFCGDDRVVALDGTLEDTHGEFLRDAQGAIAWLRWGSRVRPRVP